MVYLSKQGLFLFACNMQNSRWKINFQLWLTFFAINSTIKVANILPQRDNPSTHRSPKHGSIFILFLLLLLPSSTDRLQQLPLCCVYESLEMKKAAPLTGDGQTLTLSLAALARSLETACKTLTQTLLSRTLLMI